MKSSPPDRQLVAFTPFEYMPELATLFSADRRVLSGWRIVGTPYLTRLGKGRP